jgi:anti-sigma B factor antagonist
MADFGITSQGPPTFFLQGELDMATVPLLEIAIADAVARGGPITIDVSHMTFIDSTGLKSILKAVKALPSGCIILHGVHDGIQRILEITGVDLAPNLHIIPCAVPVRVA